MSGCNTAVKVLRAWDVCKINFKTFCLLYENVWRLKSRTGFKTTAVYYCIVTCTFSSGWLCCRRVSIEPRLLFSCMYNCSTPVQQYDLFWWIQKKICGSCCASLLDTCITVNWLGVNWQSRSAPAGCMSLGMILKQCVKRNVKLIEV